MVPSKRRARGQRGATLVEAAIITPVFLLFIFGIFEFGFAFRDFLGVANVTRDAAREASVAGDVTDADYRLLLSVQRSGAALPDGAIDRLVIFEASGPTDNVPATCKAGTPVSGLCNVYSAASLNVPEAEFGCQELALGDPYDSPDRFWCPRDREVSVGSGLDYVGVYVRITHDYITGLFGNSVVFEDQMILKMEPQEQ